ncbi:MAG: hypothetical protein VX028_00045 [Nanoarchaeota archaeon]|nr:hypothetical protein [Nanoarchaeota archaeon]
MADFKEYVQKLEQRISTITSLFDLKKLTISSDVLKESDKTDYELLYFSDESHPEDAGLFVFGSQFFVDDLSEQEFKEHLSLSALNFQILRAYKQLKEKQKKVKITDILNQIQDRRKDSSQLNIILRRILTLSYYLNWEIKRDKTDLEGDSFIEIPDKFLFKLKQRFNFENVCSVYENKDVFVFLNARNRLNLVFKNKNEFTKEDIVKYIIPTLRKIFKIKTIDFN